MFLHGFGSTKEDYADVIHQHDLTDRPVLAYDAPGCGASTCPDLSKLSIPFLVAVASEVLAAHRMERYHLIGHSMGGLTALVLADQNPARRADAVGELGQELARVVVGVADDLAAEEAIFGCDVAFDVDKTLHRLWESVCGVALPQSEGRRRAAHLPIDGGAIRHG